MELLADRLRIRYEKTGRLRFTSQRDIARVWERILRQIQAPLKYSEGFSPHPLLAFGIALPTGAASNAEYIDIRLDPAQVRESSKFGVGECSEQSLRHLVEAINERTPEGLIATAVGVLDGTEKSLQEEVACVRWELVVFGVTGPSLEDLIQRAVSAESLTVERERKGRAVIDDIRSNIESLTLTGNDTILAQLATQPRGIRPMELLKAVDPAISLVRATRTHQWIDRDGVRSEPLSSGAFMNLAQSATTSVA